MSNLDYSLPTNGLHCPIPRVKRGSGRVAISSGESPAAAVVVVVAVVEALDLL